MNKYLCTILLTLSTFLNSCDVSNEKDGSDEGQRNEEVQENFKKGRSELRKINAYLSRSRCLPIQSIILQEVRDGSPIYLALYSDSSSYQQLSFADGQVFSQSVDQGDMPRPQDQHYCNARAAELNFILTSERFERIFGYGENRRVRGIQVNARNIYPRIPSTGIENVYIMVNSQKRAQAILSYRNQTSSSVYYYDLREI